MSQPTVDKLTKAELLVLVKLWQPMDPWRMARDIIQSRIAVASQRHGVKQAAESEALKGYADAAAACDAALKGYADAAAACDAAGAAVNERPTCDRVWGRYQRARAAQEDARQRYEAACTASQAAWTKLEQLWAEQDALWRDYEDAQSSIIGKSATAEDAAPIEES